MQIYSKQIVNNAIYNKSILGYYNTIMKQYKQKTNNYLKGDFQMNVDMLKRTISALGLSLCILCASLITAPNVEVKTTETPSADVYRLMDDNNPERS